MCRTFISSVSSWEIKNAVRHGITFLTDEAYVPSLSRNVRNWFAEFNFFTDSAKLSKNNM